LVAHLIPDKGIQILVEALRQARSRLPAFHLSVAGAGPMESQLRSLVNLSGLTDCVRFSGSISSQAELLRSADLLVMPSLWKEACPFVALEAMATAVPVIASAVGGLPRIVGDGPGLLVPPGDAVSLADAIVRLAADPDERRRMGQAGLRRVMERYSVESMVDGQFAAMQAHLDGQDVSKRRLQ
jgi:glycosyltransferase involved in cell wall biosynthesis